MSEALPHPPRPNGSPLGHVLLSSMRDEGPYLLEFVAHHRAIGFDHLFIASNDCRDGTDLLLDALDAAGAVTHFRSVVKPGEKPQHAAYAAMRELYDLDRADWLMVLDADEFLYVGIGDGRIQDLTSAASVGTDFIALNARSFGTTDDPIWRPGLVTEQFTLRLRPKDWANGPVKCLTRQIDRFRDIHNHSMVRYQGTEPLAVMRADRSEFTIPPDRKIWDFLRNVPPDQIRHDIAHYNHYAIKSLAAFCLRQGRGRGAAPLGEANDRHTQDYFERFAQAKTKDVSFLRRYGERLRAEYARLLALPGVEAAQRQAEQRYGEMIDALLRDEDSPIAG